LKESMGVPWPKRFSEACAVARRWITKLPSVTGLPDFIGARRFSPFGPTRLLSVSGDRIDAEITNDVQVPAAETTEGARPRFSLFTKVGAELLEEVLDKGLGPQH